MLERNRSQINLEVQLTLDIEVIKGKYGLIKLKIHYISIRPVPHTYTEFWSVHQKIACIPMYVCIHSYVY